jgi:hypothetical protein
MLQPSVWLLIDLVAIAQPAEIEYERQDSRAASHDRVQARGP